MLQADKPLRRLEILLCDTELTDVIDRVMGRAVSKSGVSDEYTSFQQQR